jgi:hypothetical protein
MLARSVKQTYCWWFDIVELKPEPPTISNNVVDGMRRLEEVAGNVIETI